MPLDFSKFDKSKFSARDLLGIEDQRQTQLNANMTEAVKVNPDQHAETTNLSKQSGVPEFAVQSNPEQVKQSLKLDQIDLEGMSARAPKTSKFLTDDVNNSVIAQEDVFDNLLEGIERTFDSIGKSIGIGFDIQGKGLLLSGADATPDRIQDLISPSTMPIGMEFEAQLLSQEFAANLGIETDEDLAAAKQEASDRLVGEVQELQKERQLLTPEDLNIVQEGVRAGVESLANMAPGVALTMLSGGRAAPLLATIGAQTFTGSYAEGRADGLTPEEARWFASIDAAIEVGTELLPTGTIERVLTGKSTGLKKEALKFVVQEMGTEQLATALQTVNSFMFGLDKELENAESASEIINIQLRRQAVTAIATVVAGGAQITAATAVNKTVSKLTQTEQAKETQGDVEQRNLDKLNADSAKSKLRERDVESFKQFVREADGENNSHVFIDGVQTSLYLQGKTREEIEADPALKTLSNALNESRATGADVAVPVDEFMGDVAGTDAFTELRDHMTMSEETVSPFRQEQHQVETEAYVETLMAEAQESASEYVEAQEIYTTVRDQLIDTGAVNAANASIMAQVVPAWATAQAKRSGKTVQQVYTDAGLTIEGPQTGELARLEGEQVLSQAQQSGVTIADDQSGAVQIEKDGENRGEITYSETDDVIQIKRSDVTTPGEGIGTDAYVQFINDKVSQGKTVVSDNIVSESAQRLYEKLGELGFTVEKNPNARLIYPGKITTLSREELKQQRDAFGTVLVDGVRTTKPGGVFEGDPVYTITSVPQQFAQAPVEDQTETEEFKEWSGNGEVVESEDINDHEFKANTPTVVKVFHGTTHEFSVFDALRGNLEGQFGAVNYFTSSESDASDNYAGEGPDLTNRIEQRAEQIEHELGDTDEDTVVELSDQHGIKFDPSLVEETYPEELPRAMAREELSGGQDQTMELYVRVDNPFVIGENAQWIEFVDDAEVQSLAIDRVSEDQDVTVEEINENIDDYEDAIDEVRWEIQEEQEHPLIDAIQTVANRHDVAAAELAGEVYELGESATPEAIEALIRGNEEISYAEDPETGVLINSQLIAEIIEEMGFDSIILKNAESRFSNMNMESDTAHVHIFDSGNTNIKSVENQGTFDPTDPDIFKQKQPDTGEARGYYDPANSVIRLTESADLSTFLHEFAHFMYEMEASGNTDMNQSINNWYKRNSEAVAKEANSYLGGDFDTLKQTAFHGTQREFDEFDESKIGTATDTGSTGSTDKDNAVRRSTHEQRKQRAREQGFDVDTVLYHGTDSDISEFRVGRETKRYTSFTEETVTSQGVFLSPSREDAETYGGNVRELYIKSGKQLQNPLMISISSKSTDAEKEALYQAWDDIEYILRPVMTEIADDQWSIDTSGGMSRVDIDKDGVWLNSAMPEGFIDWSYLDNPEVVSRMKERGYDSVKVEEPNDESGESVFIIDPKNIRDVEAEFQDPESANLLAQSTTPPTAKEGSISEADVVNYLDNGSTGNTDKDNAIRRAVHEQFARGFETYLMEGKAPSIELRNAFRTFARWLARIYQALRGDLNVNLDAEMRQVFDRLLATEEQIAAAESRARVEPMFTDAAMAGMTEEEFSDYQKRQEKVKDVQTETLRDKLIKAITRKTKQWWKEEKADLVDEELSRLSNEQVYSTANRLKNVSSTTDIDNRISEIDAEVESLEKQQKSIEKKNDTVGKFITKAGGLNRLSMAEEGVDPEFFKTKSKVFGKPLFPKKGGLTADDVAELLNQENFNGGDLSANDAVEIIQDMLSDDTTYVNPEVEGRLDDIENEISNLETEKNNAEDQRQSVSIKLDHATVKEMVGEERTDKRGRKSVRVSEKLRGMTAKGQKGVHPDEAAAFFGYNSGSEMLADLMTAPPIKEAAESNAEARMVERHGDVFTDGTIEQQADEAVQNEERGKLILHELKILARGTNQRTIDRQTMKSIAEERIGNLSFREIHPGKYRKAEIRAAQESARMLAEGNKEGAAQAKTRQALNYYLGMAATEAKNETTKIVDRMARYNKKKVREEIQKAEGGYWEQIVKILERFEFRKSATLASVDQVNQDINTWAAERMDTHGDGLVLANVVLNESYVTHWKNVAYSDLQGVNDSVKNIEHVARYSNKLTRMGEEIEYNKLVDRLVTTAAETGTGRFKKSASTADDLNWVERKGRWAMAQMTKIPYMMSWMDGMERVGTWFTTFSQPMTDAYNAELELFGEVGKPVVDLIQNRSKEDMKRHNTTYFIPEIKGTAGGTHTGNLKGHEIIAVALNTGNEGNLKKLLLGEQWATEDTGEISLQNDKLQAVLKHMTKSDWQMVQQIWDQIDILYPKLAEVHRRTTGLIPPKVEATPVETEHGTFKGGYYPVKYDPTRDNKAAEFEERKEAEVGSMFASNASIQASVNTGATNERTGYFAPIHLTLNVVPNHIQETIHYITHHDAVREVNRLLRDPRVKDAVVSKLGPEEFAQLKPWLNDIAKDGRNAPNKSLVDAMFNRLRLGTTLGVMGFKASTGIIQISGLSNTIAEVGIGPVYQSMRTILGSVDSMKSAWEFANEKSKVLKHRVKTMDREIMNAMKQLESKRGVLAAVQEASMKHIALIQTYMVDLPSWHAAYIKELSESGDEAKAFQYADWVIENVQGSGVTKDMAGLMRNQTKTHTIFTMFMTFFSALWNLQRDLVKGKQSGKYSTTTVAAKAMFLFTIPVLFEMMMRGEFAKEDQEPEELVQETLTKIALYPLATIPYVRDVVNGLFSGYGYSSSPVTSILEQGLQGLQGAVKAVFADGELTKGQIKSISKLAGAGAGIPGTGQAWATGEHLYDVLVEGEEFTTHQFLFGPERK